MKEKWVTPEICDSLSTVLEEAMHEVVQTCINQVPQLHFREIGIVKSVSPGIATITGLAGVGIDEMVRFQNGIFGMIFDIEEEYIGCIILGDSSALSAGSEVERMHRVMDVPVGDGLLGRVLNPLSQPLDAQTTPWFVERRPVEREAPPIMDRLPVTVPLQTGIKVVDALIPIGRGQRQLILGDRQTGKTSIALSAIKNQRDTGVICVYCAIGQRGESVAKAIAELRETNSIAHTIVVVAEAENGPGLQYLAPYVATAIGEYFMESGRDVLVVYDDLGSHARAYRELSLLMRRPPGREAFPGDIFYIHSRLLERATHLRKELGGGSLTALPIVETEAQNISGYIPTNLISITDGQLYLSPHLFQKGLLPAIDVGKSVSRVGGKTQLPAFHAVSADLKLFYSQFEELEMFSRFGTRLDEHTKKVITHGRRIRQCLKQSSSELIPVLDQIMILLALTNGLFDEITEESVYEVEKSLRKAVSEVPTDIVRCILDGKPLSSEDRQGILSIARTALTKCQGTSQAPL
ncbi:MAG: alternate F1F0 ATPase, F1 subunit alpha [Candidatus Riflebacteria bacterium]|nr:alternate F1F0 ATPase, F1 subunit alpha [Candidatus Riflebacteria bacterium]